MFDTFATSIRLKATAVVLLIAIAAVASSMPTRAMDEKAFKRANAGMTGAHFLALGIGKSGVVDLPRDAKDVLVANPAIANAVMRSARRAYLIGVAAGQTSVIFFDSEGRQLAA